MTGNSRSERTRSPLSGRILMAGLFLLVVSVPLLVVLARSVPASLLSGSGIVPLPRFPRAVSLFPPFAAGEFDATSWLWELLVDLLHFAFAVVYYVVMGAALLGAGLGVTGAFGLSDPRRIGATVRRTLELRIVRVVLSTYAVLGVAIAFPVAARIAFEVIFALFVWIATIAVIVDRWRSIGRTDHVAVRVALWYPLPFALLVLPLGIVGVAAPSARPWFLSVTGALVAASADAGFHGVAGAFPIGSDGALALLASVAVWLTAVFVMGWTVGALTELLAWALPRLADLAAWVRRGFGRLFDRQ